MMDNRTKPIGTLEMAANCFAAAALAGIVTFVLLMFMADWTITQAIFGGFVIAAVVAPLLMLTLGRPLPAPTGRMGEQAATAPIAHATAPGKPGMAANVTAPRDVNKPSPHLDAIPESTPSDTSGPIFKGAAVKAATAQTIETAPATRVASPAPINADEPAVARPVGATHDPATQAQPTPLSGTVISPEPPQPMPGQAPPPRADRNAAAMGNTPVGGPAPTATATDQSYNERAGAGGSAGGSQAAPVSDGTTMPPPVTVTISPRVEGASSPAAHPSMVAGEGTRPMGLAEPRDGRADDLRRIRGIGPRLEQICNGLGFWHYDQIAAWTPADVVWVDRNLEGFRGRVSRDEWVHQARVLVSHHPSALPDRTDGDRV